MLDVSVQTQVFSCWKAKVQRLLYSLVAYGPMAYGAWIHFCFTFTFSIGAIWSAAAGLAASRGKRITVISRELSYGVFSRTTHCNLPSKSDSAKGAVSVNTWGHAWDEIVIRLHRSLLIHFNDFSLQTVCRDMSSDGSCYMFGRPLAIPAIQA